MKILFVCTGNTCRSPMAEGLCALIMKDDNIDVSSAGISVLYSQPPSKNAVTAVKKYGVDISSHTSHQVEEKDVKDADIVIAMTNTHKMMLKTAFANFAEKIFTIYEYAENDKFSDVSDPYGGSIDIYEKCCDELYSLITNMKKSLDKNS